MKTSRSFQTSLSHIMSKNIICYIKHSHPKSEIMKVLQSNHSVLLNQNSKLSDYIKSAPNSSNFNETEKGSLYHW